MQVKSYLPQTRIDPRIELRESRISGTGMLAREPIKRGETVCIVGGSVMTEAEFAAFQSTHSLYSFIQIDTDLYLVEDVEMTRSLDASMNPRWRPAGISSRGKKSPWTMLCSPRAPAGCWITAVAAAHQIVAVLSRATTGGERMSRNDIEIIFLLLSIAESRD